MGKIILHEEAGIPATPVDGVILFPTFTTPSILKIKDDTGNIYTFAKLEKAQTFTGEQTIAPSDVASSCLLLNMPASTGAKPLIALYNGVVRLSMLANAGGTNLTIGGTTDAGANYGPYLEIDRNSNAATPSAGFLFLADLNATYRAVWPDNAGNLRISTSPPTNSSDTGGVVVGTQTSMAAAKNISETLPDLTESLRSILTAAQQLRAFSYKSGAYNHEEFPIGVVTDLSPRYGMDRDAEYPHGKSLNIPVVIGDLIAAVALLAQKMGVEA